MPFCGNCGTKVDDGAKFCPECGALQEGGSPPPAQPQYQQQYQQAPPQCQQAPPQYGVPQTGASNDTLMGVLAYIGILVLIPILAAKDSPFAKFHANQGLTLCIGEIVYMVAYYIIAWVLSLFGFIGMMLASLLSLVGFVFLAFSIIGIINVCHKEYKKLPIIGDITFLK